MRETIELNQSETEAARICRLILCLMLTGSRLESPTEAENQRPIAKIEN